MGKVCVDVADAPDKQQAFCPEYCAIISSDQTPNCSCVAAGWARYVLTWQMQLTDSKVRPSGSPGRDTSMADLLGCQFPEHSTDCKFASKSQLPGSLLCGLM